VVSVCHSSISIRIIQCQGFCVTGASPAEVGPGRPIYLFSPEADERDSDQPGRHLTEVIPARENADGLKYPSKGAAIRGRRGNSMTKAIKTYGRGSEWRRWDLHVHTPGTALNDQFGDWEEYLDAVEAVDGSIAVIGVTDYFTLRSYKAVLAYRGQGRLSNIGLVIPNIEFRLTPVTGKGKAINLHLLISPAEPDHVLRIEEALAKLTIDRDNDPLPCTEEGLRRLGRRIRPELSIDPEAAFVEGG
jgi:hypothetical protein